MKRILKKALSLLLICLMIITTLPVAFAATGTAVVIDNEIWAEEIENYRYYQRSRASLEYLGGKTYSSLASAVSNAGKNETVVMCDDLLITGNPLKIEKNVTIDMNGHSVKRTNTSSKNDGNVITVGSEITLSLQNCTHDKAMSKITGGYTLSDGGGIYMNEKSILNLDHISIYRNRSMIDYFMGIPISNGFGGGIFVNGDFCKIFMTNSDITGNGAEDDGGGIYVDGDNFELNMDANSSVAYNEAGNKGGGIYVDGESNYIKGGNISFNATSGYGTVFGYDHGYNRDGGGIYINDSSCTIDGVTLRKNKSYCDGGAIYADSEECLIRNCTITENLALSEGGGVFFDNDYETLSDTQITSNHAKGSDSGSCGGGGVFVTSSCNWLTLSGVLTVTDNTYGSANRIDNIFLNSTTQYAYIDPSLSLGSRVGIRTDKIRKISYNPGAYDVRFFFSDDTSKHISWENDRYLHIKDGHMDDYEAPVIEYVDKTPTKVNGGYNSDGRNYDLLRGGFNYTSMTGETEDFDYGSVCYYSDGYFMSDSSNYNNHLATMSLNFAMSAFNSHNVCNGDYSNADKNVVELLDNLDFADVDTFGYKTKPSSHSIAAAMGNRELVYSSGEKTGITLIAVAIRGAGYESEWVSNLTLGTGADTNGEAKGFASAANTVKSHIDEYISNNPSLVKAKNEGNLRFWLTGFSRAAATSNLTAKRLTDEYGKSDVFCYTFEAPQGGTTTDSDVNKNAAVAGNYTNIHNIINDNDVVPYVAPAQIDIYRYGTDHMVPGIPDSDNITQHSKWHGENTKRVTDNEAYRVNSKAYNAQKEKMLNQLRLVNDDILFDDYWSAAYYSMASAFLSFISIDRNFVRETVDDENTWFNNQSDFIASLVRRVPSWILYGNHSQLGSAKEMRLLYSECNNNLQGYTNSTVEEALGEIAKLVMSSSSDRLDEIINACMVAIPRAKDRITSLDKNETLVLLWDYAEIEEKQRTTEIPVGLNASALAYEDIFDYCELSLSDKIWLLQYVWTLIANPLSQKEKSLGYTSLQETLGEEDYRMLMKNWFTIGDIILSIVSNDYKNMNDADYVGTIMYNMNSLGLAHSPEICLSWLRSYDDLYENEINRVIPIPSDHSVYLTYNHADDSDNPGEVITAKKTSDPNDYYDSCNYAYGLKTSIIINTPVSSSKLYYRNVDDSRWIPYQTKNGKGVYSLPIIDEFYNCIEVGQQLPGSKKITSEGYWTFYIKSSSYVYISYPYGIPSKLDYDWGDTVKLGTIKDEDYDLNTITCDEYLITRDDKKPLETFMTDGGLSFVMPKTDVTVKCLNENKGISNIRVDFDNLYDGDNLSEMFYRLLASEIKCSDADGKQYNLPVISGRNYLEKLEILNTDGKYETADPDIQIKGGNKYRITLILDNYDIEPVRFNRGFILNASVITPDKEIIPDIFVSNDTDFVTLTFEVTALNEKRVSGPETNYPSGAYPSDFFSRKSLKFISDRAGNSTFRYFWNVADEENEITTETGITAALCGAPTKMEGSKDHSLIAYSVNGFAASETKVFTFSGNGMKTENDCITAEPDEAVKFKISNVPDNTDNLEISVYDENDTKTSIPVDFTYVITGNEAEISLLLTEKISGKYTVLVGAQTKEKSMTFASADLICLVRDKITISAEGDSFTYGESNKTGYKNLAFRKNNEIFEINDYVVRYTDKNGNETEAVPTQPGQYTATISLSNTYSDYRYESLSVSFSINRKTVSAPVYGIDYSADYTAGKIIYDDNSLNLEMSSDCNFTSIIPTFSIEPGKTYYIRFKEDEFNEASAVSVFESPYKEQAPYPPELKETGCGYFEIYTANGQEYSIDGGRSWQKSGIFNNLKSNETYYVCARFEASESHFASYISNETQIQISSLHIRPVKHNKINSTCSNYGVKEYYECSCGSYFEDIQLQTPINNLAQWKETDGRIEKVPHTYGSWLQSDEETHNRICAECKNTEYEKHSFNNGVIVKDATETSDGTKRFTCNECDAIKDVIIPATGKNTDDVCPKCHGVHSDNFGGRLFCFIMRIINFINSVLHD